MQSDSTVRECVAESDQRSDLHQDGHFNFYNPGQRHFEK